METLTHGNTSSTYSLDLAIGIFYNLIESQTLRIYSLEKRWMQPPAVVMKSCKQEEQERREDEYPGLGG